jgi:hypothetical protein
MGLVTLSGGNFGAILESWSWLNATAIVTSAARKTSLTHLLEPTVLAACVLCFRACHT